MKMMMRLIPVLLATLIFMGCSNQNKSSSGKASTTTGWQYNNPENGGFEVKAAVEQQAGPGQVIELFHIVSCQSFFQHFQQGQELGYRDFESRLTQQKKEIDQHGG